MKRIPEGPFGGLFDSISYDSPAFIAVLAVCGLLIFTWIAVIWAFLRRTPGIDSDRRRGFEVKLTAQPVTEKKENDHG
jgi:hypothetical protein